jgi:hypothetical protein
MTWPKLPPVSVKVLEKYCPCYGMIGALFSLFVITLLCEVCNMCQKSNHPKIVLMTKYHLLMQSFYEIIL